MPRHPGPEGHEHSPTNLGGSQSPDVLAERVPTDAAIQSNTLDNQPESKQNRPQRRGPRQSSVPLAIDPTHDHRHHKRRQERRGSRSPGNSPHDFVHLVLDAAKAVYDVFVPLLQDSDISAVVSTHGLVPYGGFSQLDETVATRQERCYTLCYEPGREVPSR